MRLLLIRHGQTPANVRGELSTAAPGPGLTRLGTRQATQLVAALSREPIDAVFASTLVRTTLTGQPIALDRELPIVERRGLHEIEAGDLEDRTDPASVRRYLETVFAWGAGRLDVIMPGGSDGNEFFYRFDRDIDDIASRVNGTAAVFSHGAAIRVWAAGRASNVNPRFAAENELHNTGIVELEGEPGDWRLVNWAGSPVGGRELVDATAEDPTGESLSEAREESRLVQPPSRRPG